MGAGQSHVNIYLELKDQEYKGEGYTVTSSKKITTESANFEVVTHSIDYKVPDSRYFDIYIYNNKGTPHNASYIFAYCSPWIPSHVAKEVKAYYSILTPHIPLVISFVRGSNDIHNCEIDKLRSAGWNKAAYITEYSSEKTLLELLKQQFTKLLWDRTIQFTMANDNENVMGRKQELNDINYRFIFIPREYQSSLGLQSLYGLDYDNYEPTTPDPPYSESKNQIDPYFLTSVNDQYYAGILVYFAREKGKPAGTSKEKDNENKVLLLEFIDPSKQKKQIKRKDKDGYWWAEETVPYNNDASLIQALAGIKSEAEKEDINTVLIDKRDKYLGVTFETAESGPYKKYTHKFSKAYKTALLFERRDPGLAKLKQLAITAMNVEVYYLQAGGKEDKKPFLIVLDEDATPEKKKGYHFNNKEEFKDWVAFTFNRKGTQEPLKDKELTEKLYEKVKLIDQYGPCTNELHLLRDLVYKILMAKDEDPPPEVPKPKEPPRPDLYPEQPKPPEPLPLGWIITGSVGGAVFIIGSTVGYGVYWYNTTIRLLT
ncbi:hypothetical protein MACJ_002479 [Theileria orientalis]|uniref:Uncharacterized protein n=1 Tax=Theileria orientalis TaxID=68886 RepID=A0A976QSQ2_THEOR|nr:hypothetical protein MACJ_002479 [Theileria orientalis]